ncbi:sensor domain-containing diguanylate cyclase [Roseospira marina]|uniref:sensor domain-containing diguanylate cyclase n=1 Tax=Roseospira marina TaxID=140057 RepID=UPI001478F492|nr:diguanylate cyclase [Roseospira marina]MBB4312714.1 diguanylate cyclase (GGDEF)-like protein [Roseospira marina]MBB5086513.1 diguanylate cyclase (GGDEF)-like protein [Roseospira marina]
MTSVRAALQIVGDATGVSRAWIFQTLSRGDDHVLQDHIFEYAPNPRWAQLHRKKFRLFRSTLDDPSYRHLVEGRIRGQPAAFVTDRIDPGFLREDQESQSILSMLTAPIMVGGEWWGTLGLDDCERAIQWSPDDTAYLQTAAGLISGAIHRQHRTALARQVTVIERFTGSGMWELVLAPPRLWCSDSLFTMLGYPPPYAQMNVRRLVRHLDRDDQSRVMTAVRACLDGTSPGFRMDCHAHRLNGTPVWLELITDTVNANETTGRPGRLAGLVLEASERKARELELGQAALTDTLTGLPNRRAFQKHASRAVTDRSADTAVLMVDIDHFKQINDSLGHAAGDEALRALARMLRAALRDTDLVARMGGEEFAILLAENVAEAYDVAERIRQAVASTIMRVTDLSGQPQDLSLTVSLGLAAQHPTDGQETLDVLLSRADRALYSAKRAGRNRVCVDQGAPDPADGTTR